MANGLIYPGTVQEVAAANLADGLDDPSVVCMSQFGCSGKYPGNVARDMMRCVRTLYNIQIEPYHLHVDVPRGDGACTERITVPVLPPHELFASTYAAGWDRFAKTYLGPKGVAGLCEFWRRSASEEWVLRHPALASGCERVAPSIWHSDGVEVYAVSEYYVWSFRSALSEGVSWDIKQFTCCMPHHEVADKSVRQKVEAEILRFVAWSLKWAGQGLGPPCAFYGEQFKDGSYGGSLADKPLAGGWRLCFAGASMDLKAKRDTGRFMHHWQGRYICEQCCACMPGKAKDSVPALTYRDFWPSAFWRQTCLDHEAYVELCRCEGQALSPWAQIPGWRLELALFDWMHTGPLGLARDVVASALCSMIRDGVLGGGGADEQLRRFVNGMRAWLKAKGLPVFRCSLTMESMQSSGQEYPMLPTYIKAAHMKWITLYAAHTAKTVCNGSMPSRLRSVCLWAYCACAHLMENAGPHFEQAVANRWAWLMRLHLRCLQELCHRAMSVRRHVWKITPKAHVFDHMARHVEQTCRNPMYYSCYGCEDFLGKLKHVGLKCHSRTMPTALISRVQLNTALRWKRARACRSAHG